MIAGTGDSGRRTVGLCLMKTEEAEAVVAYLEDTSPYLRIQDRRTFYLIEGEGQIHVDMAGVSEYLGYDLPIHAFLVSMASFYGRAQVEEDGFLVSSDMLQLEGDDVRR